MDQATMDGVERIQAITRLSQAEVLRLVISAGIRSITDGKLVVPENNPT